MKIYETLYHFNVIDAIKAGKAVYVLDKETAEVHCVNYLRVDRFVRILEQSKECKERFEFWHDYDTEEKAE